MGILVLISVTAVLAMLDITIKSCIENGITRKEERETLKGKVILRKVYNRGFGLNVLQNDPDTVKYVSSFATIILTITQLIQLMRKKGSKLKKIGLSLMTAGAWSNTFDRWLRGYVIDYIGFENKNKKIEKITWNLGDFFLIAGGIIVSLGSLLAYAVFFIQMVIFGQLGWFDMAKGAVYELYVITFLLTALAWYRHRANIKRLLNGTENKFGSKK